MIRLVWSRTIAKLRAEKVDLVNGMKTAMETIGRLTKERDDAQKECAAQIGRIAELHLALEQAEAGHKRQIRHSRDLQDRLDSAKTQRDEYCRQRDAFSDLLQGERETMRSVRAHHGRVLVELGDYRRHLRGLEPEARKAADWLSRNCGTRSEGFGVFVELDAALVDLGVACGTPSDDEAVRISKENC